MAQKYLSLDKGVAIYEEPALTYTQFYLLLSALVLVLIGVAVYLYYHAHKRMINRSDA
ncbi:MAG: hypothetical protein WBO73_10465 [Gammaproteobacteria bacterium]